MLRKKFCTNLRLQNIYQLLSFRIFCRTIILIFFVLPQNKTKRNGRFHIFSTTSRYYNLKPHTSHITKYGTKVFSLGAASQVSAGDMFLFCVTLNFFYKKYHDWVIQNCTVFMQSFRRISVIMFITWISIIQLHRYTGAQKH
jgi:hypothetical protein